MDHDLAMQEVVEGPDITCVTSGQPAGDEGLNRLHAFIVSWAVTGRLLTSTGGERRSIWVRELLPDLAGVLGEPRRFVGYDVEQQSRRVPHHHPGTTVRDLHRAEPGQAGHPRGDAGG